MSGDSKSLSDKISELINPNPVWDDPENVPSETTAKLVKKFNEFVEDESVPRSTLKLSEGVLLAEEDKKYTGKKVSRKNFGKGSLNPSSLTTNVDLSSGDESLESSRDASSIEECEIDEEESDDGASLSSEEDATCTDDKLGNDLFSCIKSNSSVEKEKSNAVRSQIRLWDSLLEARIQLQKCLLASNQLPVHNNFDAFKRLAGSQFVNQLQLSKQEGLTLLNNLIELQTLLLSLNSETRSVTSEKLRKKDDDEEIFSGDENCSDLLDGNENSYIPKKMRKLSEISKEITDQDVNFKRYRDDTLQKWYLRSKAASVKSSNFSAFDMSILKQIEHGLRDREGLIKRTQKRRSSNRTFGENSSTDAKEVEDAKVDEEFDCEIFNDDDFYHKLLRELIERKSADLADPTQLGRQWSELQKLRNKLKKRVDTKASKGRKIRYVVHSNLVNFMAPLPMSWNDSAMDDLFRSLFGNVE